MAIRGPEHFDGVLRGNVPQLQPHHRQVLYEQQRVHQRHRKLHYAAVLHLQYKRWRVIQEMASDTRDGE